MVESSLRVGDDELTAVLGAYRTESGRTLLVLVDESPVLLIFLRHFSCAFCAATIDRVSKLKEQIAARGVRPVFVHLGTPERAKAYFDYYHLKDVERVSNPDASLYQSPVFALGRKHFLVHFLFPKAWYGWLVRGAMFKYGIGMIQEDGNQMPGVFFLKDRRIASAFRYRSIADEPDFLKLIGRG
jgi:peroxiredoxin